MTSPYPTNTYRCRILRVIDGDTLEIQVDLGLRVERHLHLRLTGIDAPETRGKDREAGLAARAHMEGLISEASRQEGDFLARFEKGKSFDRWLGSVFQMKEGEEEHLSALMVRDGHAVFV